jgi:hypothetical protein
MRKLKSWNGGPKRWIDPLKDPETADNLMLADDSDAERTEEDDVLRDETDATEEKMFEQVDDADDTDN